MHWSDVSRTWRLVGPPLRPGNQDLALFEKGIKAWSEKHEYAPSSLILGVTPELYNLDWPLGSEVFALDASQAMIEAVWPGPVSSAMTGSWTSMPVADSAHDIVLCDGGVGLLGDPEAQLSLLSEVKRVLKPGGVFVVRLFAPSGHTGTTEEIVSQLQAGEIESLDALKLRLWGALHNDLDVGVKPRDVARFIESVPGGKRWLIDDLGWSKEHVETLSMHKHNESVYHLVNAEELIEMATMVGGLEGLQVDIPLHRYGAACPVVSLLRVA